ncbi:MAG TPA: M14 family zinc carboxypeptidase [Draconibacterium sp.]|nr:M14 family zinc carboxypeptidase [Draconibacterium sp.]
MKKVKLKSVVVAFLTVFSVNANAQLPLEPDDPAKVSIPDFYKSKLSDIDAELAAIKKGKVEKLATSPGGLPVFGVFYGEREDFHKQANYNSAVAAKNTAYYAKKGAGTKPVVYFIGPVHGQEVEGIAGLVNLIHIAETGRDYRGREWPLLSTYFSRCRVIIIPSANPDGRKRCPYDSFVGLPTKTMTKYGQGTKKDGTFWGWPDAKSVHPMKGDVKILGAYFNDNGVNIMHDEFFAPMADETKAIMKIALDEAPDITVSLHSCECNPFIIQNSLAPVFMQKRIADLAAQLNKRYINLKLPHMEEGWSPGISEKDTVPPAQESFNLVSALHYATGTMSFTFESPHGTVEDGATHGQIIDIQLGLYEEILKYILNNRLYQE